MEEFEIYLVVMMDHVLLMQLVMLEKVGHMAMMGELGMNRRVGKHSL